MSYTQEEFDRLQLNDKESAKFVRDAQGNVAVRVKGTTGGTGAPTPYDASTGDFPTVTEGVPSRYIISVAGTLPAPVGAVEAGAYLFYDGNVRSAMDNPANDYVNPNVSNIALGGIGANSGPFDTSVQTMIDRLLYPFSAMTASLGAGAVFEKGVDQAPITLSASFTKSSNPVYPVTEVVFKRGGVAIDTKTGADLTSPQTFIETTPITDTTVFSAVVTDGKPETATPTKTLTALYPYFRGKVTGGSKPTKNQALINSGTKVVADSTGTIAVNFASAATDWIRFAIPATSTSKATWYIDALNNGAIGGVSNLFDTESLVAIDSPSVFRSGVQYKIYVSNYTSAVASSMQLRN